MAHQQMLQGNPYDSPHDVDSAGILLRHRLRLRFGEKVFFAILAFVSVIVHWTHRDLYEMLKVSTVSLLFCTSLVLALAGCVTASMCRRTDRFRQVMAFATGVVCTVIVAPLSCWTLIATGQPPSGLIVFASVTAGVLVTLFMLSNASDRHPS